MPTFSQEPEVALPPIGVTVDCDSSPEWVRITNNTTKPVKIKNIGSTWQKRAGEPYKIKKTLKPGKSVAYSFGTGDKKGKRLSGRASSSTTTSSRRACS